MRPSTLWTLLILAIALLLRLDGLGSGLHLDDPLRVELGSRRDERAMAQAVLDGPLAGHADPGIFLHWGSGGFWTFGVVDLAVAGLASLAGGESLSLVWERNPSGLLLLHRMVSAVAGVLTVFVLLRAAAREVSARAALIASALLACCYLHVNQSHMGTLDVLLTLWISLAWARSLRWMRTLQRGKRGQRHALLAGVGVGLATATKTIGILSLGLVLLAWWLGRRGHVHAGRARATPTLLLAMGAAAATLLLLSPHLFWSAEDVAALLSENSARFAAGLGDLPGALGGHLSNSLGVGFGWVGLALALVGTLALGTAGSRRERELLVMALAPLVFLAAFRLPAPRYALPTLPGLCLLAALGVDALARGMARNRPRLGTLAASALVLAALALPLRRSLGLGSLLHGVDTRVDVAVALSEAGAAQDEVLAFGVYGLPGTRPGQEKPPVVPFLRLQERLILEGRGEQAVAGVLADPPPYLLHERSRAEVDALGWDLIADLVTARYERVLRVDGRRDGLTPSLPDERSGNPSSFVPWARPWLMQRPGPALDLYRLREP